MIGQDIGSIFLVPLALEKLAADPLAEGNCYPGDLLCSLLGLPQDFWRRHSDLRSQLDAVIANTKESPTIVDNALQAFHDRMA